MMPEPSKLKILLPSDKYSHSNTGNGNREMCWCFFFSSMSENEIVLKCSIHVPGGFPIGSSKREWNWSYSMVKSLIISKNEISHASFVLLFALIFFFFFVFKYRNDCLWKSFVLTIEKNISLIIIYWKRDTQKFNCLIGWIDVIFII